jgi:hypothetical protein
MKNMKKDVMISKMTNRNVTAIRSTIFAQKKPRVIHGDNFLGVYFFIASSTATATATVIPTMGLLPAPIKPIISCYILGND